MRQRPIVPLPAQDTPQAARLVATLMSVLGYLVPLLEIALVKLEAGLTIAAAGGAGTALLSSTHVVDWTDCGADEWRLVGYGTDGTSSGAVLHYKAGSTILASVTVPQGGADDFAGDWMRLTPAQRAAIAGDRVGQLVAVGTGANITLYAVAVQARTVTRVV